MLRAIFPLFITVLFCQGKLPELQPGMWRFTTETSLPGLDQKIKNTTEFCIKNGDLREFEKNESNSKSKSDKQGPCDVKNIKNTAEDKVEYDVVCENQEGYLKYAYKYTKTSFDGSFRIVAPGIGDAIPPTRIKAERIGECKK